MEVKVLGNVCSSLSAEFGQLPCGPQVGFREWFFSASHWCAVHFSNTAGAIIKVCTEMGKGQAKGSYLRLPGAGGP